MPAGAEELQGPGNLMQKGMESPLVAALCLVGAVSCIAQAALAGPQQWDAYFKLLEESRFINVGGQHVQWRVRHSICQRPNHAPTGCCAAPAGDDGGLPGPHVAGPVLAFQRRRAPSVAAARRAGSSAERAAGAGPRYLPVPAPPSASVTLFSRSNACRGVCVCEGGGGGGGSCGGGGGSV